ncbi:CTD small phosphatase [Raphidocelis subcapitata]|uniref:CTD small phosphatase n=1 Tax=Raphidocelis subcapitata TaxID=307507 RepID=A0A2V0PI65_9CHLO|nr:CTD small phosphatase [Raphidocelis subcapitata]|eukprot:GBF99494.1 CTD small phosphatase [Raphidocelis subcapitata]
MAGSAAAAYGLSSLLGAWAGVGGASGAAPAGSGAADADGAAALQAEADAWTARLRSVLCCLPAPLQAAAGVQLAAMRPASAAAPRPAAPAPAPAAARPRGQRMARGCEDVALSQPRPAPKGHAGAGRIARTQSAPACGSAGGGESDGSESSSEGSSGSGRDSDVSSSTASSSSGSDASRARAHARAGGAGTTDDCDTDGGAALRRTASMSAVVASSVFAAPRPAQQHPWPPPKSPRVYDRPAIGPPRARDAGKKLLVLDLDETLVHSSFRPVANADFILPVEIDGRMVDIYVTKRPWVDHFLSVLGQRFEVAVFTASLSLYADPLLDILDRTRCIKWRLFRESCCPFGGTLVKDLACLGRDLAGVIIIDNSPNAYSFHPDNAVPIATFIDDAGDRALLDLVPQLLRLADAPDVRPLLGPLNVANYKPPPPPRQHAHAHARGGAAAVPPPPPPRAAAVPALAVH